jgi:hypothetical protein
MNLGFFIILNQYLSHKKKSRNFRDFLLYEFFLDYN